MRGVVIVRNEETLEASGVTNNGGWAQEQDGTSNLGGGGGDSPIFNPGSLLRWPRGLE